MPDHYSAERPSLYFDANAMDGLVAFVHDATEGLRRHVHDKATLSIPGFDGLHNVAARWEPDSILESGVEPPDSPIWHNHFH